MTRRMADLITKLPPNCQVKNRGKYSDVYFMVHPSVRPDGWPATIKLGRTDKATPDSIIREAKAVYRRYVEFRTGVERERSDSLAGVIKAYRQSRAYTKLSPRTRRDYDLILSKIEAWSKRTGDAPISELTVPSIIRWLETFGNAYTMQRRAQCVLSVLYQCAYNKGYVSNAKLVRDIKLSAPEDYEKGPVIIWTEEELDAAVAEADRQGYHSIGGILLTAMETSQRRSDVVAMINGRDYKNGELRYYQQKTKKHVWFKATKKLRSRLDTYHSQHLSMFICEETGRPWHPDSVTHRVRKILDAIGLEKHRLMYLRHSQINYLFSIGCTREMIIAVTGHNDPETTNQYYLEKRNEALANQAIDMIDNIRDAKLQTKVKTRVQTNRRKKAAK